MKIIFSVAAIFPLLYLLIASQYIEEVTTQSDLTTKGVSTESVIAERVYGERVTTKDIKWPCHTTVYDQKSLQGYKVSDTITQTNDITSTACKNWCDHNEICGSYNWQQTATPGLGDCWESPLTPGLLEKVTGIEVEEWIADTHIPNHMGVKECDAQISLSTTCPPYTDESRNKRPIDTYEITYIRSKVFFGVFITVTMCQSLCDMFESCKSVNMRLDSCYLYNRPLAGKINDTTNTQQCQDCVTYDKGICEVTTPSADLSTASVSTGSLTAESVTTEGVTSEGVTTEGVTTEGVTTEGVTTEGVTTEGVTTEGVTTEGVTTGSVTKGGVTISAATTGGGVITERSTSTVTSITRVTAGGGGGGYEGGPDVTTTAAVIICAIILLAAIIAALYFLYWKKRSAGKDESLVSQYPTEVTPSGSVSKQEETSEYSKSPDSSPKSSGSEAQEPQPSKVELDEDESE